MFSPLSIKLTASFGKKELQEDGIYFTPRPIIERALPEIFKALDEKEVTEILEPSCGSCEFVNAIQDYFGSDVHIDAVEYNSTIYQNIRNLQTPTLSIYNANYLTWNTEKQYDLIVGNPPYFVMKKSEVHKKYHKFFEGRPNIYVIFILRALEMLKNDGVLTFILPINFLNCLYYSKTRHLISTQCRIVSIVCCDDISDSEFKHTQQNTIILTLKKTLEPKEELELYNNKYILRVFDDIVFNTADKIEELKELYRDSTTLSELKVDVNVGTVVWNQCTNKENTEKKYKKTFNLLTDDSSQTLLVYSSNIEDGKYVDKKFKDSSKKSFINMEGLTGPTMVINRGYGKGSYSMNYCVIDFERPYLLENHLICLNIKNEDRTYKLNLYDTIALSLQDPRTERFIELYFGNSAINCIELKHYLPIYI
jgi:type I restriction-modification system DNA methylase subunit